MATLTAPQRVAVWADYMTEISNLRELAALTKTDLKAAVDAVDDWVNTNAAAFNTAIPQPARGALTSAQKARLLMFVVSRRFKEGL